MVMHARKLPRLNDGYFERNQGHSYQGAGKYNSSKSNYNERYNDKMRESPSNGGNYRNESPDSQHSPRDRSSYHNKSSYSQRVKERERERHERDASRSPKEKASKTTNRDHHHASSHRLAESAEHRNNHDRNNTEDKDKEKRIQVGDWSEHISSSGKKYYYNCKTEISQWEKPKEWMEWERQQGKPSNEVVKVKERNYDKSSSASSSSSSTTNRVSTDKHSSSERNSRLPAVAHHHHHARMHDERHRGSSGGSSSGGNSSSSATAALSRGGNSQLQANRNENHVRGLADRNEQLREMDDVTRREDRRSESRKNSEDSQMQDMDISPDSTPPPTGSSQPNCQPQSRTETPVAQQQQQAMQQPTTSQGSVSIASLPKLLSQLAGNKGLPNLEKTELSAQEALQTLQRALLLTRQVSLAQTSVTNQSPHTTITNVDTSPFLSQKSPLPLPMPSHGSQGPIVSAMATPQSDDVKMRNEDDRAGRLSPGSEYSHRSSRRGSPTSSVSSLHSITPTGTTSLASAALRPVAPLLTPSLANYFREDLIGHVTGWQADHAERQMAVLRLKANQMESTWKANRYCEDAHSVGSLNSTKVSAELKMARSLVRVAEIQSTLQEQRILFLRQQIKELEEWKSQNSFMSDS